MEAPRVPSTHLKDEPPLASAECRAIFQKIAESCARAIQANRKGGIAGKPDAIHAMRIELTRLRAAARFFRPWIAGTEWQHIEKELGRLNAALGKARNWDVTVEYVEQRRYRYWAHKCRHSLLRSQNKAHRRLRQVLCSARFERTISVLRLWLGNQPVGPNGGSKFSYRDNSYCESRLRAWRDELVKSGRRMNVLSRKQLHRLRIRFKHYRYLIDSLLELDMTVSREDFTFYDTAKRMHQYLGEIRDLGLLRKHVGRWPPHYRKRKRELILRAKRSLRPARLSIID